MSNVAFKRVVIFFAVVLLCLATWLISNVSVKKFAITSSLPTVKKEQLYYNLYKNNLNSHMLFSDNAIKATISDILPLAKNIILTKKWPDTILISLVYSAKIINYKQTKLDICPSKTPNAEKYQTKIQSILMEHNLKFDLFVFTCASVVRATSGKIKIFFGRGKEVARNIVLLESVLRSWQHKIQYLERIDMRYKNGMAIRWFNHDK